MELILISIIAVIVVATLFYCYNLKKENNNSKRPKLSFAEAINLCSLPVVCFKCHDKNINLLIDSGANNNLIDANIIDEYDYRSTNLRSKMMGVEGNEVSIPFIEMDINYRDDQYTDKFQVADMSSLFGSIKRDNGVTIHGILGNNFFQRYKYILNFDELTFYHV